MLNILSAVFGGLGAAKNYQLQKQQGELQKDIAQATSREEAGRIKKTADIANLYELKVNLAEKMGVSVQDLERLGLSGVRDIADTAAMQRTRATGRYGEEFGPRGPEIEGYRDRLERDLIEAGRTEADIASMFTQPVQSASTGGGLASWGNLYNDAMGSAARDIESYAGEGAGLMAAMGATRKADEQTYLMGRDIGLADTGETSMTGAWETDIGLASQLQKEQKRKAEALYGRAGSSIDRGYNIGESVFVEPSQTNPYGAISNIFSNASKINWRPPTTQTYSGMGQSPNPYIPNHPGLR